MIDKPTIKFWGNGDIHTSSFNAYRKCYPNAIATFRTELISYPEMPKVKITRLDVQLCNKKKEINND